LLSDSHVVSAMRPPLRQTRANSFAAASGAGGEVDGDRPPWRGVVRVQTEIGQHCSGALVGPRLVLTAAHCLFGCGTGQLVRPASVHVLVGYSHGDYAGHARAISIEIEPGFVLGPDQQTAAAAPLGADWAVLTLDAPLGTADRVLPLVRDLPAPGTPAMLGGYEQDRAHVIVADTACVVVGPARDASGRVLLRHSCAGTRGVSGAPLLARMPAGSWAVVGLASTAGGRHRGRLCRAGRRDHLRRRGCAAVTRHK
jgi:protease YdgD